MAIPNPIGFLFEGTSDRSFAINTDGGTMASFEVDALLSETHTMIREVTDNEVENGSPVSDHVIQRPITLEVQCFVSDAPIKGLIDNVQSGVRNFLGGSRYTSDCFSALIDLFERKEALTVYTEYRVYRNMMVESITIPRTPEDGEALIFTIGFKQVRMVETATTKLPKGVGVNKQGKSNASGDAKNRATPSKDIGKNTGKAIDPNEGASILKGVADSGGRAISDIISKATGALNSAGFGL